jgi:ATP-dependent RNA helicase RhlE
VRRGVKAGIIHGNKGQGARTRALADFKAGHLRVLVATDIAARGLDIEQLPLVVNFDLPLVAEDYVHRIGRTGRAGHRGRAVSLVSAADSGLLREIERLVAVPLERLAIPGVAAMPARPAFERPRPQAHRPASGGGSSRFGQRRPARGAHAGRPHSLATQR